MSWYIVTLTGHRELYGLPRIVQAEDSDEALLRSFPDAPSSKKVLQANVYLLDDNYTNTIYPINVPKPEWLPGKEWRRP